VQVAGCCQVCVLLTLLMSTWAGVLATQQQPVQQQGQWSQRVCVWPLQQGLLEEGLAWVRVVLLLQVLGCCQAQLMQTQLT
jgi:hypothetical protein